MMQNENITSSTGALLEALVTEGHILDICVV